MSDLVLAHGESRSSARAAWSVSEIVLVAMPLVVAMASRSGIFVVVLAAVAALVALTLDGELRNTGRRLAAALRGPVGIASLVFLAWCVLSLAWSPQPAVSLRVAGEFALPLVAVTLLAIALPARLGRAAVLGLGVTTVLACVLILGEFWSGLALRRAIGLRDVTFIFNRPAITLVVLGLPLLWLTGRRVGLVPAGGLALLIAATVLRSDSGASILGLAAAGATWVAALVLPRLTRILAGLALVACFATAPYLGEIAGLVVPPAAHERLRSTDSQERIEIWKSFGDAVRAEPVRGTGFGTSLIYRETAAGGRVRPDRWERLASGHPHNAFLQIWAELGGIGVLLALGVGLALLREMRRLPAGVAAPMLALAAAVAAISLVGHGVWQGWWIAAIGAAIVWFRSGMAPAEAGVTTMPEKARRPGT